MRLGRNDLDFSLSLSLSLSLYFHILGFFLATDFESIYKKINKKNFFKKKKTLFKWTIPQKQINKYDKI